MTKNLVEPRTFEREEFFTQMDANHLFNSQIQALLERPKALIMGTEDAELPTGGWHTVEAPFQRINHRDMFVPDASNQRLYAVEEGLYLSGFNGKILGDDVTGSQFARIRVNDDFLISSSGPYNYQDTRDLLTWGVHYAAPGDFFSAQVWANSGEPVELNADLTDETDTLDYSPSFWALQLGGRQKAETWTTPTVVAATDRFTSTQAISWMRDAVNALQRPPYCVAWADEDSTPFDDDGDWHTVQLGSCIAQTSPTFFQPGGSTLRIPETGVYLIGSAMHHEKEKGTGRRAARIVDQDDNILAENGGLPARTGVGAGTRTPTVGLAYLESGDTIHLEEAQTADTELKIITWRRASPVLWAVKVGDITATPAFKPLRTWSNRDPLLFSDINDALQNLKHLRNPPMCKRAPSGNTTITNGAWRNPPMDKTASDGTVFDTDQMADPATSYKIKCKTAGTYLCGGVGAFGGSSGIKGARLIHTRVDGTERVFCAHRYYPSASGQITTSIPLLRPIRLAVGETIHMQLRIQETPNVSVTTRSNVWAYRLGV